jgi:diguanylate cyclase (GGDEF)-like protein
VGWSSAASGGPETVRRVRLGAISTAGAVCVFGFAALFPGPEHISLWLFLALAVPAIALAVAMALATPAMLAKPVRQLYFYAWTAAGVVLISAAVGLTGGGRSNLYLLYTIILLFAACFYTRVVQVAYGVMCAGGYILTLTITRWDMPLSPMLVRGSVMVLVAVMGSYMAAEKDRMANESDRRAALLRAVAGAARDVNLVEVFQSLESVTQALGELGLAWGHVSLIDETAGTYRIVQGRRIPQQYLDANPPLTAGIVGMVYQARSTVTLGPKDAPAYVVPVLDVSRPLTSVIGSPLWVDGRLAGVLAGASVRPGGLLADDIEAFELLAGVASRALEGSQRFQQMAESEARNRHQAYHDDLTGLPNRALLITRMREALVHLAGTPERQVALLLIDLYDFKLVNDTMGHATADQMLKTIASRLADCVRDSDTVGRLSGDEFAVVVPAFDHGNLDRLAQRLLRAVSAPIDVDGHSISIDASAGIALRVATAMTEVEQEAAAAELMSNADVAMYEAKRAGKHSHVVFDQAMADRVRQRMTIGAELPRAIEAGEMSVHYQPIFDLCTRSITGFEALLRWSHPRLGSVPPSDFIPMAEESGAIIQIGRWVLHQACTELQALRSENVDWAGLTMSVNLSTRQLRDPELVEEVLDTLQETQVPPAQLTLEITESSLLYDAATSQAKVAALGALGVRIALDDFGTGYSSLAYLQQLQVHCLKIDKSFVDGVDIRDGGDPVRTEPALIRSMADLGGALGLDTVAEGIETEGQLAELKLLGCHLGQGYVFSPAVVPAKLRLLLALVPAPVPTVSLAYADEPKAKKPTAATTAAND